VLLKYTVIVFGTKIAPTVFGKEAQVALSNDPSVTIVAFGSVALPAVPTALATIIPRPEQNVAGGLGNPFFAGPDGDAPDCGGCGA